MSGNGGVIEEVTLNWTDLTGKKTGATSLGSNKFYKARITQEASGYKVTFNYGRVGQAGQTIAVPCATLDQARAEMKKKVDEKVAKGYTKLDMRSETEERQKAASKGVDDVAAPKKAAAVRTREFHPEVENLLKLIYNATGAAVAAGLSASAGATKDAPCPTSSWTRARTFSTRPRRSSRRRPRRRTSLTSPTSFSRTSRATSTTRASGASSTSTPFS
jgi:predicted DNA-binding WGR domain protein